MGAILAPGKRTVAAALRAMGLESERTFHRYHRVLSRATWSSREASCVLLRLLVEAFVPDGLLVVGIDETLERRRGKKIRARGIYRDPVRSNRGHFVKASGLRWVCVMLLALVPGASRVWALPFLSLSALWHRAQACPPCRYALGSDPRDPQAEFRTQALLCTDLVADPGRIIGWFVRRWQMETTFQEVRQRLGFETQRHWSERAIRRVAPAHCWPCSP